MSGSGGGAPLTVRVVELQRRLRVRSEHVLRVVAMEKIARRYPDRVVPAAIPPDGWFWRRLFVPLYTRVSWTFKRQAMEKMKMTSQGWAHAARGFGEPWRPPHVSRDGDAAVSEHLQESLNAGG